MDTQVEVGRGWQYMGTERSTHGALQAVRIYNRALTDEEIEKNYQIDKARFDIK